MNDGQGDRGGRFGALLLVMAPFFSVFPALGLMLLGLSGSLVSACIGKSGDALGLLKACRNWCLILCVFAVLALVITMAATVISVKALWARQDGRSLVGGAVKLGGVILFLEALVLGALVFRGDVLSTVMDAQADIRQIESGTLETESMWIYPGSAPAHLPGPYGAGQPTPLMKFYAADVSLESWDPYLFPAGLGFAPEAKRMYTSSQPREWNEANVPRYEITYTSRLRFVVRAGLAEGPIAD